MSQVGSDEQLVSMGINLELTINPIAEFVVPSTVLLGYALAMIGSIRQRGSVNQRLWLISLGLSGLGVVAHLNEFIRYFAGYGFQLLYAANLPLIVVDWAMFAKDKSLRTSADPVEATDRSVK